MSISSKTAEMIVKQLIYDSCMIVEKGTIISIQYDIQCSHKKHDGRMENLSIMGVRRGGVTPPIRNQRHHN